MKNGYFVVHYKNDNRVFKPNDFDKRCNGVDEFCGGRMMVFKNISDDGETILSIINTNVIAQVNRYEHDLAH